MPLPPEIQEELERKRREEHQQAEYFDGGVMPAVGDGYYALIHPLPPGEHVIELGGSLCGSWAFETLATYTLHVQAPPP